MEIDYKKIFEEHGLEFGLDVVMYAATRNIYQEIESIVVKHKRKISELEKLQIIQKFFREEMNKIIKIPSNLLDKEYSQTSVGQYSIMSSRPMLFSHTKNPIIYTDGKP